MSSCTLLFIVLCIVWLRLRGGACRNLEARSQNSSNHTTHTNKVRDPFCKRKWFGISKRVQERFLMAVFTPEGQTSPRLNSPTDNQIWCREFQRKYSSSADPLLSVVVNVYLLSNTKWVLLWRSQRRGGQPWSSPFGAFFGRWCFPEQRRGGSCWDGGTNAENISIWRRGVPEPEWKNS